MLTFECKKMQEPQESSANSIVVITGLSGAGKSNALRAFEDEGYYCIDNLPPVVVPDVLATDGPERLAMVLDIRGRRYFGEEIEHAVETVREADGWSPRMIFLESDEPSLVRRYKESRRPHPNARGGDVLSAIRAEREELSALRERADVVIDTSGYSAAEMITRFRSLAGAELLYRKLTVSLISFGFKHGIPLDVDMLLDVRFLPNPHYDPELSPLTGHDESVKKAVLGSGDGRKFLERLHALLSFLLPKYAAEGKTYFTLGIGCTGGHHRSVAVVDELSSYLRDDMEDTAVFTRDRDLCEK
jgi:UPF0042 nucleotide-binding protein